MLERFNHELKAYRLITGQSQSQLARALDLDHSHVSRAESGQRFITAERAEWFANYLVIPYEERAQFYLLAAGHAPDIVSNILNPAFLQLSMNNSMNNSYTPNEILAIHLSKQGWSQAELARVTSDVRNKKTHPSSIAKIVSGVNKIGSTFAEELAIAVDIPMGYRAEFFLLSRGHDFTEIYESLTAIGGTVKPLDPALP